MVTGKDIAGKLPSAGSPMAPNPTPLAARRILIVDDQESIRDILRTALTEAGAGVLEAGGGAPRRPHGAPPGPGPVPPPHTRPGGDRWDGLGGPRRAPHTPAHPRR